MIILVGSQKGGCGKSTLTINIAAAPAKLNKDVIIVDIAGKDSKELRTGMLVANIF